MTAHKHGCCFCCHGNNHKVTPLSESNHNIVEIRPKRYLRIQHLNPQPRDEKFEQEMHIFMEYKRTGIIPAVTGLQHKVDEKGDTHLSNNVESQNKDSGSRNPVERPRSDRILANSQRDKSSTPNQRLNSRSSFKSNEDHGSVMSSSNVSVTFDPQGMRLDLDNACRGMSPTIQEKDETQSSYSKSNASLKNGVELKELQIEKASESNGVVMNQTLNLSHSSGGFAVSTQSHTLDRVDKVLFFLHGVGGSSDIWKAQIDFFSNLGYEIVAPDLIGHGMSFAPNNHHAYHFDEILDDMEEIFDRYCKRKNYLIGHSYGCAFLTVIARTRSRRVNKMILISGGGPTPLAPQPGVFTLPLCLLTCIKPCISCRFKHAVIQSADKLVVPKDKMFDIPSYVLSYIMNGQHWPNGDDVYHNWITVHTLLICGQKDNLVMLEEEQDMNKTIYGSSLEIVENTGHMVMVEAPSKVNSLIHSFIEDCYGLVQQPTSLKQDSLEEEEAGNQLSGPASYHGDRGPSRLSQNSAKSVKSAKSSKSMPRSWFSGRP